jgi:hypothetical protein
MKKLFFSAVALIAFSSVSMANTIDLEEIEVTPTCATQAAMDTDNYEQAYGCLSSEVRAFIYQAYLNYCRSLTKTIRLIEG